MLSIKDIFARRYAREAGLCFVLMPYRPHLNKIYKKVIKPTIEQGCGMRCVRADETFSTKSVLGDVWEHIQKADIVVADLTERSPNVFYELGLCHAAWKRVILLAQSSRDVPFDLRQFRVITYKQTPEGAERLSKSLARAVSLILNDAVEDDDVGRAGLTIKFPSDDQSIYGEFEVWGEYKNRPALEDVRSLVASVDDMRIWPQGKVNFNLARRTWSCKVNLWDQPKPRASISIVGLGRDSAILCDYYGTVGRTAQWIALPELAADAVEYAQVIVVNGFSPAEAGGA